MSIEQITTPQELEGLRDVGMAVVLTDDGYPAIVWMGEDQAWHSIRAVNEDDGPWENQPAHVRRSLAVNAGIEVTP